MPSVPAVTAFTSLPRQTFRVVFVEPRTAGIHLDMVKCSADGWLEPGAPLSFEARLPWSAWALAAAGALERWAARQTEVSMTVEFDRGTPRVRMTDGLYSMLLDLRRQSRLELTPA